MTQQLIYGLTYPQWKELPATRHMDFPETGAKESEFTEFHRNNKFYCAGCDKKFDSDLYTHGTARARVSLWYGAPAATGDVYVCPTKNSRSKVAGRVHGDMDWYGSEAQADCAYKARLHAARCPGCGEHNPYGVGTICRRCADALDRGRVARNDTEALTPYYLEEDNLLALYQMHSEAHAAVKPHRWTFLRLFAAALRGKGARLLTHATCDIEGRALVYSAEDASCNRNLYGAKDGTSYVELTEAQAKAAVEFIAYLYKLLPAVFEAGREAGQSLLTGLAAGRVSIETFNKATLGQDDES